MFKEVFDILLVENQSVENSIKAAQLAHSLLKRGDGLIDFRSNNCHKFWLHYKNNIETISKDIFHDEKYLHILEFNNYIFNKTFGNFNLDAILICNFNDNFLQALCKTKLCTKRLSSILNKLLYYNKVTVFQDTVKFRSIGYGYIFRAIDPIVCGKLYSMVDIEYKEKIHSAIGLYSELDIISDIIKVLNNESELIFSEFIINNKEMICKIICSNLTTTDYTCITDIIDFYLIKCEQDYICKIIAKKIESLGFRVSEISQLLSKTLINCRLILAYLCELNCHKRVISEFCKGNAALKNYTLMI